MKKFITFLLLSAFVSNISYANELDNTSEEYDYQEVYKGETVPYDGYLFTYDGISNVAIKMQTKIKLLENKKEEELSRVKLDLQSVIDSKNVELSVSKKMYETQLQAKQEAVSALTSERNWGNIKIIGGIVLGVTLGVVAGFIVAKL